MMLCREAEIVLNTSTLEKIVNDPEGVLENEETFWQEERAQKLTRDWANNIGYEISYEDWREKIGEWAALSLEERKAHVLMENTRKIVEGKDAFLEKALPHLCSFLPEDADINVTVQFTAFIPPNAFAQEDIIINAASPTWKDNVDNILNILVHEIFHAGYGHCRDVRTETPLEDDAIYQMLDNIHNEGVCTYVGFKALPMFPSPDDRDYPVLDDPAEVKRQLGVVNHTLSQVGKVSEEDLKKMVWEECIVGRGYYITGTTMCRVIDESQGREALIETLTTGPLRFVEVYNSLVKKDMRLHILG